MIETTRKLIDEVEELKNYYMKMVDLDELKNVSEDSFSIMQSSMKLLDLSEDVLMKQAETLTTINNKLNILLENKG